MSVITSMVTKVGFKIRFFYLQKLLATALSHLICVYPFHLRHLRSVPKLFQSMYQGLSD
jgi:hypothetical protein